MILFRFLFTKFTDNLGISLKRELGRNYFENKQIPMLFCAFINDKQILKFSC